MGRLLRGLLIPLLAMKAHRRRGRHDKKARNRVRRRLLPAALRPSPEKCGEAVRRYLRDATRP